LRNGDNERAGVEQGGLRVDEFGGLNHERRAAGASEAKLERVLCVQRGAHAGEHDALAGEGAGGKRREAAQTGGGVGHGLRLGEEVVQVGAFEDGKLERHDGALPGLEAGRFGVAGGRRSQEVRGRW
jgi:hypothetical protein